jgi:hypothetical protein
MSTIQPAAGFSTFGGRDDTMGTNTNAPVKTDRSSHRSFHEQQANLATAVTSYSFRDGEFVTISKV